MHIYTYILYCEFLTIRMCVCVCEWVRERRAPVKAISKISKILFFNAITFIVIGKKFPQVLTNSLCIVAYLRQNILIFKISGNKTEQRNTVWWISQLHYSLTDTRILCWILIYSFQSFFLFWLGQITLKTIIILNYCYCLQDNFYNQS